MPVACYAVNPVDTFRISLTKVWVSVFAQNVMMGYRRYVLSIF